VPAGSVHAVLHGLNNIARHLDVGGVEHHAKRAGDCRGRKVVCELCTDGAAVAVSADNLAPHDTLLAVGAGVLGLGLVDIGNTLAEVELGVLGGVHTLDANKSLLLILVPLATTIAKEDSARVQTSLGGLSLHCDRFSSTKV